MMTQLVQITVVVAVPVSNTVEEVVDAFRRAVATAPELCGVEVIMTTGTDTFNL